MCCLGSTLSIQAQEVGEEGFLVKPYLQFSTQTSMVVLWETKEEASSVVVFGEARANVSRAVLDRRVSLPAMRQMHEVLLDGLKAETNYFYQVSSVTAQGDTIRSALYSFKTSVKDSSAYLFALVGDSQRNSRTPWAWGKIAERVWQDRPNFVIHAGDLVDQGFKKSDWIEDFFPNGHVLMSRIPVYHVLGNHEQDAPFYYQYTVAPPPEYYYTFTYGNTQFFMLDTNRDVQEGSEQYEWLDWALARSTATWKMVVHHHPPYSSDSDDHGDSFQGLSTLGTDARNLVPLYEQYGVDFCLFGHTHLYERSWPIKEERINMKEGVVYINSGGAGGSLEDFTPSRNWFTLELQSVHHYCTFSIFGEHLVFKAIDHEGRMLDAFQMQKQGMGLSTTQVMQPPAAHVKVANTIFQDNTKVSMEAAFEDLEIRYTLDGSDPTRSSLLYAEPLTIDRTTEVKTRAYTADGRASRLQVIKLRKMEPLPAVKTGKTQPGLRFSYFEGDWSQQLPDFSQLQPLKSGVSRLVNLSELEHRDNYFAAILEGFIDIAETGGYTFFLNSDDGSRLFLDGELIVDHDGNHSAIQKEGKIILAKGKHRLRVEYFDASGSQYLQAGMLDAAGNPVPFSPFQLSH